YRIVLRCCDGQVVLRIVSLQSGDVRDAHAASEERVFAVSLLSPAPPRVAEDVQIRGPEIEASHNAGVPFARILHVLDAPLDTDLGSHGMDPWGIEGGSQTDGFRILSHAVVNDSVEGLTPPLICGDIE